MATPLLLEPHAFQPVRVGSVAPRGWLLKQLTLQAEGLSGHLAQFWPDVMDSVWIGGDGSAQTQTLHERTPYWLNGVVPLMYLLRAAGIEQLGSFAGIYRAETSQHAAYERFGLVPVNLTAQVERYMDYILGHQAADGWLGPPQNLSGSTSQEQGWAYWARSNIMFSLAMYAEGMADGSSAPRPERYANVTSAMLRYALCLKQRIGSVPMFSLATVRWQDIALGVQWLVDHAPQGESAALLELGRMLHAQGYDWESWFEQGTFEWSGFFQEEYINHNVDNAQALKSAAVIYRQSRNTSLRRLSHTRVDKLDAHCGLPTGMFIGDELIPPQPGHNPSRGIELCGVVEAMFSHTTMFSVFGEVRDLDRAERIAYNALPATWASPRGGDMWAHQYLQVAPVTACDAVLHNAALHDQHYT